MNLKVILLLLLLIYSVFGVCKEGFKNDNTIYQVCSNKYNNIDNNYLVKTNNVSPLPVGFYSSLLNVGGARGDRRYLEAPICEGSQAFNNNYFINNKLTDCLEEKSNCDKTNNGNVNDNGKGNRTYKREFTDPIKNPYELHVSPEEIVYNDTEIEYHGINKYIPEYNTTNFSTNECTDKISNCKSVGSAGKNLANNLEPLEDPFFLHGKVGQNNKITYSDTITKNILSAHDVNVEEIVNRAKTL